MRLRKISVKKLFGIFDYEIPLNLEKRVTVLHGLNGSGKTVLLKMIAALLSRESIPYEYRSLFRRRPFDEFSLDINEKSNINVTRVMQNNFSPAVSVRYDNEIKNIDGWHLNDGLFVRLVETQRLLQLSSPENPHTVPMVKIYSQELLGRMQETLSRYAAYAQETERTFPLRLLKKGKPAPLPASELRERLGALEARRQRLIELGLLDPEKTEPGSGLMEQIDEASDENRNALTVYVRDTEEKFLKLRDIELRLEFLTRTVNRFFSYKRLRTHREAGFIIELDDGRQISADSLSSGEQHVLILLYELLFKTSKDSLILIDEPEISFHVAWQSEFLDDLLEIVKLVQFDVILATHSPTLIGAHWDLAVELKGPPRNIQPASTSASSA